MISHVDLAKRKLQENSRKIKDSEVRKKYPQGKTVKLKLIFLGTAFINEAINYEATAFIISKI